MRILKDLQKSVISCRTRLNIALKYSRGFTFSFRIRGAYLVRPYIESDVFEKTKRKGASAEEAARVASGMNRTLASAMAQKAPPPPGKQGKADAKTKVGAHGFGNCMLMI